LFVAALGCSSGERSILWRELPETALPPDHGEKLIFGIQCPVMKLSKIAAVCACAALAAGCGEYQRGNWPDANNGDTGGEGYDRPERVFRSAS
jgi:hypothetical protein